MKKPIEKWSFARTPPPAQYKSRIPVQPNVTNVDIPKTIFRPRVAKLIVNRWGLKGLRIAHITGVYVLGLELILGGICFWDFHKMNTDQEHRKHVHEARPWALESFYWTAEKFQSNFDVRKNDYEAWGVSEDAKE